MTASKADEPLVVGGRAIAPGAVERFELPVALLPTQTAVHLPLTVLRGKLPGPRVWLSAAVHGDELNGVEIIARVLDRVQKLRRGAILALPIVNVFGFLDQSRYLPDRRDLNRSFPGSERGSLAGRLAHVFMTEVVAHCTHGIDLHTAAQDRSNFPQVRADLTDPETRAMADAFHPPVMLNAPTRQGSLRGSACKRGARVIVYEGGEAQRFNEFAIEVGVRGVLGVLHSFGMISTKPRQPKTPPIYIAESSWLRARRGGVLRLAVEEGETVQARQTIGVVADPFGADSVPLRPTFRSMVIGMNLNPVVYGGDAVVHLGRVE